MKLSRTTLALLALLMFSPLTSAHKRWFMPTDFVLSEAETVTVDFTASNNIFFVDRITNERVDQLPVLPSLALSLNF